MDKGFWLAMMGLFTIGGLVANILYLLKPLDDDKKK